MAICLPCGSQCLRHRRPPGCIRPTLDEICSQKIAASQTQTKNSLACLDFRRSFGHDAAHLKEPRDVLPIAVCFPPPASKRECVLRNGAAAAEGGKGND